MNIQFNLFQNVNSRKVQSQPAIRYQYGLKQDTVSFGAIKKSQLDPYQLLCANYFKAPLEKFNEKEDLKNWAREELLKKMDVNAYPCESQLDTQERVDRLTNWREYLLNDEYMKDHPTIAVFIADSITRDLYPETKNFPPLYDQEIMSETLSEMDKILEKNPKATIGFKNKYQENIRQKMLETAEIFPDKKLKGRAYWVHVPSMEKDSENIDRNLKTLNVISTEAWCTKGHFAKKYLKEGDFYILMDKNQPEISVRTEGDKIVEVRDRNHDANIPLTYSESVKELKNGQSLDGYDLEIQNLEHRKALVDFAKQMIQEDIDSKNYANILRSCGIEVKVLDDGMLELSKFKKPHREYTYQDLGINENEMFRHIHAIRGTADFGGTQVTNLGALKEIDGYTFMAFSKLSGLGKVKTKSRVFWE